jgi:tartrate dehydratase beta subunit/fumarate hydratase class I family protein
MGRGRTGSRAERNVQPGIYLRAPTGAAYLIIAFVKAPKYQKRYDHYGVAERVVDLELELEMSKAFEKYCGMPRR